MTSKWFCAAVSFGLLLILPALALLTLDVPLHVFFELPPRTLYIDHKPFSWPVFIGLAIVITLSVTPFLIRAIRTWPKTPASKNARPFPWWGYLGLGFGGLSWLLAWTRFDWFAPLQAHTFTPLWLSYVVVINALTLRRSGQCLLLHQTGFFIRLFLASALFWWFFEYLNRFVLNWHYVGIEDFTPWQYFWFATLAYSTVLPAVLSTREWLLTFPLFSQSFDRWIRLQLRHPKWFATFTLLATAGGLIGIGIWPNQLFSLLWVAPLLLLVSIQALGKQTHIFESINQGNWTSLITAAVAALICGFFWEMWNLHSLAKWVYFVPYVQKFHIFEMPLLGYAGYLPFGLECAAIGALLNPQNTKDLPSKKR
jgi:hypothetical protein